MPGAFGRIAGAVRRLFGAERKTQQAETRKTRPAPKPQHFIRFRSTWNKKPIFGPAIIPELPRAQEFMGRSKDFGMLKPPGRPSRQVRRAYLRSVAFANFSEHNPLMSRRNRRGYARLAWRVSQLMPLRHQREQAAA